jgi:2'-5' RNA ligase
LSPEEIRSFIAVLLPDGAKHALAALQDKLRSGSKAPVRWVDPRNIHLTLKFLGNISPGMVGRITSGMQAAARDARPLRIKVKGLGAFPSTNKVNIIWVGLAGDIEELALLQKRIDTQLSPLGFKSEDRPFTPHLTIARLRDNASSEERRELGRLLAETSFAPPQAIDVEAIHLMKSQLTREGPIYNTIASANLGL